MWRAYLMFRHAALAGRDLGGRQTVLPPQAIIMSAGHGSHQRRWPRHAAAHLGQARVALDWADRVDLRAGGSLEARRHQLTDTAVTAIDPNEFPLIAGRSRLCARDGAPPARRRGQGHRFWLSKATINGCADRNRPKDALGDQQLQLVVTDEENHQTPAQQTDWDVTHRSGSEVGPS